MLYMEKESVSDRVEKLLHPEHFKENKPSILKKQEMKKDDLQNSKTKNRSSVCVIINLQKAAGGIIHSVVKQAWNQTFLLFLIEGILIAVTIGTGMIEMLVDAALSRLAGF